MKISLAAKEQYKYLIILYCIFITVQYICDILVLRLYNLGNLSFTASSIIFCVDFAIMDIVANVYGMNEAKKLAITNFFAQLLVAFFLYVVLFNYNPNPQITAIYEKGIELKNFGLIISSNMLVIPFAVLVGNLSNSFLMAISKYFFMGRFIAFRSFVCSLSGALLMLLISYSKIYWNHDFIFILNIVGSSMLIKLIGAAFFMLPTKFLSEYLKNKEGIDVYDLKFKFLVNKQAELAQKFRGSQS